MAFNTFIAGTIVDPSAMNDNFNFIGDGDLLPRDGTSLSATTSVLDLGSADYRWAEVHVETVNIDGEMTNGWNLVSRISLDSATGSIDITGLNGDTDEVYMIQYRIVTPSTARTFYISPNAATSTNYSGLNIVGSGSSVTVSKTTGMDGFYAGKIIPATTTSKYIYGETHIYTKTGYERNCISLILSDSDGQFVQSNEMWGQYWSVTSSTITSLKFWESTGTTTAFSLSTTIFVWAKR